MKPRAMHKGLCTCAGQFGLYRHKEPLKSLRIRNLSCSVTSAKVLTPPGPGFCCCLFCLLLFIVRRMRETSASRGCEAAVWCSVRRGLPRGRKQAGTRVPARRGPTSPLAHGCNCTMTFCSEGGRSAACDE